MSYYRTDVNPRSRMHRQLHGFGDLPSIAGTTATEIQKIVNSYQDVSLLSLNAFKSIVANKEVFNNLHPAVSNIFLTLNAAAGSIGLNPTSTSGPNIIGDVITLAKAIAAQLPNAIGSSGPGGGSTGVLSSLFEGVGGAVSSMAEAVPIVGALVSIAKDIVQIVGTSSGIGMCSSDPNARITYCDKTMMNVVGTGPNNNMMPTDIFNCGYNGYGESACAATSAQSAGIQWPGTDIGKAIVLLTENCPNAISSWRFAKGNQDADYASVPSQEELNAFRAGNLTQFNQQNMVGKLIFTAGAAPGVGIPEATRTVLRNLRLAIQHSYLGGDGKGAVDGGVVLFPIYMDIILRQFRLGRLTDNFITQIMTLFGEDCPSVTTDTCFNYNRKALDQFIGLVSGWDKTINSPYEPWKSQNAVGKLTEAQMLKAAKLALAPKPAPKGAVCGAGMHRGSNLPGSVGFNMCLPNATPKLVAPLPLSTGTKVAVAGGATAATALLAILFFL